MNQNLGLFSVSFRFPGKPNIFGFLFGFFSVPMKTESFRFLFGFFSVPLKTDRNGLFFIIEREMYMCVV